MKTFWKYFLSCCVLVLGTAGCKDVLDKPPASEIDLPRYFQTANDAETLLIGCYARVFVNEGIYTDILFAANRSSDDVIPGANSGVDPMDDRRGLNASDGTAREIWRRSYLVLANINLGLERIAAMPDGVFVNNRKPQILGELRALRAFVYYNLVRLYGGVPLILRYPDNISASGNAVVRAAEEQIYTQIIEDLGIAEASVPASYPPLNTQGLTLSVPVLESKGRFTLASVRALQSDVFLTLRRYSEAAQQAEKIVASGIYKLENDFRSNFRGPRTTFNPNLGVYQNTTESIMEIQAIPGSDATGGMMFFFLDGFPPRFSVSDELSNFFYPDTLATPAQQADSVRKLWSVGVVTPLRKGVKYATKYREFYFDDRYNNVYGTSSTPNPDNYHVYRLAEIHLFRAEALNEVGYGNQTAFDALNAVRTRALLKPLTAADLPDQASFREAVRRERRLELFFEGGKRWFDILRYNQQEPGFARRVLGEKLPDDNRLLLPVPQDELRLNTLMTQNPGYQ
jgi:starch-binding outer membrane protein, SusD/RagB family